MKEAEEPKQEEVQFLVVHQLFMSTKYLTAGFVMVLNYLYHRMI